MARRSAVSLCFTRISSIIIPRSGDTLCLLIALFSVFSLIINQLARSSALASSAFAHFEGFDTDDGFVDDDAELDISPAQFRSSPPPSVSRSEPETHHGPPPSDLDVPTSSLSDSSAKPLSPPLDFWDEDEFEGIPVEPSSGESLSTDIVGSLRPENKSSHKNNVRKTKVTWKDFTVEFVCLSFLVVFVINYFVGKKENEKIALAWAAKFCTKDSIFEKNFSFLGVGKEDDSPLLLKEGQNVFKFYASGRRFCQGLLATMHLNNRHDLIWKIYNMMVPSRESITIEVYMNDDAMDHVVFASAKKKAAKLMHKESGDLQRFATLLSPPNNRKWVADELAVVAESKEVAGDLLTEPVLDQVLGEKAFEKHGKGFVSMHFSDQHAGSHKKMLSFIFTLPDAAHMADMSRLVALVPYYIDLIGRYKLSSQARSRTDASRLKVAQEVFKELENVRQEALQKKGDRKKMETEAKLSAEALQKKEAKKKMKKAMPKMKMTRVR